MSSTLSARKCNVATFSSSSSTSQRPRQRTSLAIEASCQVPPPRRQTERACSPTSKQGISGCCRQGTCRNSTCTRCQRQYLRLSLTTRTRYCLLSKGPATLTPVFSSSLSKDGDLSRVPCQHRDCSDNFREALLHEHVADQRELHLPLTPPEGQEETK